jgi:hypothetical protein
VPTKGKSSITTEIFAVYAPAKAQEKDPFWEELTTYVTKTLKRIGNNDNHHLCLVGDWNSYLHPQRDIYRVIPLTQDPGPIHDRK